MIGATGGRDTSDVRTLGPQITFDLPIFDRNQGNIVVEEATRQPAWASREMHLQGGRRLVKPVGLKSEECKTEFLQLSP